MVEKQPEKPKITLKPSVVATKPQPTGLTTKSLDQPAGTAAKDVEKQEKVPLRAKKSLSEFEKGFLAGVDAAQKTAFEHERARSVGTPITDAIQKLEPEGGE